MPKLSLPKLNLKKTALLLLVPFTLLYLPPPSPSPPPIPLLFSLITSNDTSYIASLQILAQSIRQFTPPHTTLHVLVTNDVSPTIFHKIAQFAHPIPIQPYNEPTRHLMYKRWIHQLTKLKLWSFNSMYEPPSANSFVTPFVTQSAKQPEPATPSATLPHNLICYLDADVAFFASTTLPAIVADCQASPHPLCAFESDCQHNGGTSRQIWRMRYIQANFFCLRPHPTLFAHMQTHLINPFLHGHLAYNGTSADTEQDLLNLYFNKSIHYIDCNHIASGLFVHRNTHHPRIKWDLLHGQY
jgi:hypothetical protein